MKKEIAEMWVKALRSGKYKQTNGRLMDADGSMCCLGVLSSLAVEAGHCQEPILVSNGQYFYFNEEAHEAPKSVQSWSGLNGSCGGFGDRTLYLTEMNDAGLSFEEIADKIEARWEEL